MNEFAKYCANSIFPLVDWYSRFFELLSKCVKMHYSQQKIWENQNSRLFRNVWKEDMGKMEEIF